MLKPKELKYVKARVEGKPKRQAGLAAGAKTMVAADKYANRMSKNVQVQHAIEEALKLAEATPEFAVKRLKAIAEQDEELGASRLASKDILELHGWQRGNRPESRLTIENAFFGASRDIPTIEQQ